MPLRILDDNSDTDSVRALQAALEIEDPQAESAGGVQTGVSSVQQDAHVLETSEQGAPGRHPSPERATPKELTAVALGVAMGFPEFLLEAVLAKLGER